MEGLLMGKGQRSQLLPWLLLALFFALAVWLASCGGGGGRIPCFAWVGLGS